MKRPISNILHAQHRKKYELPLKFNLFLSASSVEEMMKSTSGEYVDFYNYFSLCPALIKSFFLLSCFILFCVIFGQLFVCFCSLSKKQNRKVRKISL